MEVDCFHLPTLYRRNICKIIIQKKYKRTIFYLCTIFYSKCKSTNAHLQSDINNIRSWFRRLGRTLGIVPRQTIEMDQSIVQTTEGKLRGCIRHTFDGEEFYGFLGIPYIKPALGDLRFKAPQPPEPWTGIRDATKVGSPVFHKETFTKSFLGGEDGVNLNVYTKKPIPQGSKLNPVMVYIHGGGYVEGRNGPDMFGPEYLLTEDVVLVVINYRLGILGFLSLEDPSLKIYGNAGLKDQVAALKWVKRNIKNFGGDPDNVTIFGQSAGAAAVEYLVASPAAKGLFHRAIFQSGSVGSFWASGQRFSKGLLQFLEKGNLSDTQALEYFKSLSVRELYDIMTKYTKSVPSRTLGLLGPIEEIPNDTAFITKHPLQHIISGDYNKVPIMMGYTSNEVICLSSELMEDQGKAFVDNFDIEFILNAMIGIEKGSETSKKYVQRIQEIYKMPNGEINKYLVLSDLFFVTGAVGCAKHHAATSGKPVYLYRMSLDAGLNMFKRLAHLDDLPGVSHFDDIGYIFKNAGFPSPKNGTIEEISVRRFVKLWTNFAKYGNPTPKESELGIIWKPLEPKQDYLFDIDRQLSLLTEIEPERMKLWREIFQLNPMLKNLL
uniref:Carboxylic ester hydrolase n=1 Tax=Diabrotica virgifera virgifera TaxID=50390 RepID=A0A6P7GB44_DIAVI